MLLTSCLMANFFRMKTYSDETRAVRKIKLCYFFISNKLKIIRVYLTILAINLPVSTYILLVTSIVFITKPGFQ